MVNRNEKTARDYSEAYLRDRRPAPAQSGRAADWVVGLAIVVLIVLSFMLARPARGAEPERDRHARAVLALADGGKSVDARDRDIRVAMALAEATSSPATAPAPAPAPKAKPLCSCGDDCKCKPGQCPACPAAKKDLARLRESLVRVRTQGGSGSGTVIWSRDGRAVVLTALHVVESGKGLEVRGDGRWLSGQLLGTDKAADVALVLVAVELPAVSVAEADPRDGAEVVMLGCTSLWSKGSVAKREDTYYLIECDCGSDNYSDSGDSGGGVFHRGELVGVHCGKTGPIAESVQTPYCASAKSIRSLLAKCFTREDGRCTPVIAVPAPMKARRIIGYQCGIDQYGRRVCVPVYEP